MFRSRAMCASCRNMYSLACFAASGHVQILDWHVQGHLCSRQNRCSSKGQMLLVRVACLIDTLLTCGNSLRFWSRMLKGSSCRELDCKRALQWRRSWMGIVVRS